MAAVKVKVLETGNQRQEYCDTKYYNIKMYYSD